MLEIVRLESRQEWSGAWPQASGGGLVVGLARTARELEQVQRLRYEVFSQEMAAVFPAGADGRDQDRYDPWCEHLMVRELDSERVVGTYRILTPENAERAGGYYSENEFDLRPLAGIRAGLVECGRACTHPDYRHGGVIMLLWNGVAEILRRGGYRYVLGCASVSLRDDGATAAKVWHYANMVEPAAGAPRLTPHHRYPVEQLDRDLPAHFPPLIKGYLKLGATVCGEPAWDPDFNSADFPMLLDVMNMDDRYRRQLNLYYKPVKPV